MKIKEVYIDLEIESDVKYDFYFFRCYKKHELLDTQNVIAYGVKREKGLLENKVSNDMFSDISFKNGYFRQYKINNCLEQFVYLKILDFQYCKYLYGKSLLYFRAKMGFEVYE